MMGRDNQEGLCRHCGVNPRKYKRELCHECYTNYPTKIIIRDEGERSKDGSVTITQSLKVSRCNARPVSTPTYISPDAGRPHPLTAEGLRMLADDSPPRNPRYSHCATDELPGTEGKIRVMCERVSNGYPPFHPGDITLYDLFRGVDMFLSSEDDIEYASVTFLRGPGSDANGRRKQGGRSPGKKSIDNLNATIRTADKSRRHRKKGSSMNGSTEIL